MNDKDSGGDSTDEGTPINPSESDFSAENNDQEEQGTDETDSDHRLDILFQNDPSDDIQSLVAPPSARRKMSFFYAVIATIAAVGGGLTGWILLNEEEQSIPAPSARYEYLFPPPTFELALSSSEHSQSLSEADSSADSDKPSPANQTNPDQTAALEQNTGDQTTLSQDQAAETPEESGDGSVQSSNDQAPDDQVSDDRKQNQTAAFAPIRSPKDILPEALINAGVLPLNPEALPELTEVISEGTGGQVLLPAISTNGEQPWQAYKRRFAADNGRPLIAIIINDIGLNQSQSLTVIRDMPSPISVAFAPYGRNLDTLSTLARSRGHEILLSVPMEPFNYPLDDPGPYGLLTSSEDKKNLQRLRWIMGRLTTYVGVIPEMGSLFTTSRDATTPILEEFKKRGLLFVNRRITQRDITGRVAKELDLPAVTIDFVLDQKPSRAAIDQQIERAEALARSQGFVAVLASPYPVSLERIALWLSTAEEKGFSMAPITAIIERSTVAASRSETGTTVAENTRR